MIRGVIFDLDGLLSDTECLHCQAYQQTLSEVGHALAEADYARHWIRAGKTIRDFVQERGLPHDPAVLRRRKAALYDQLVRTHLRPMPGALELLDRLAGRRKLAVATSCYQDAAGLVLGRLGITGRFDAIVTCQDVPRVKPAPDAFLLAAERLGLPPSACVVLEDAEKGIRAACAAGMRSIAVPTPYTQDNDFSLATRVVRSLDDITLALLDTLTPNAHGAQGGNPGPTP